ncbi:SDR family oxidoreductase [Actinokineospora guangxiensis]|uniref:SDR family oxidoreductase n=1 Tax=Actinokineospora guangxiensis TaxID=1490288 RepID=A0ABW0EQP1_9PSEU
MLLGSVNGRHGGHAPGPVATPMPDRLSTEDVSALPAPIPLDHVTTPEEIAGTVEWLCSASAASAASAASVTGTTVDADGGMWIG